MSREDVLIALGGVLCCLIMVVILGVWINISEAVKA